MRDIVERLRAWSPLIAGGYECPAASTAMDEAADEIERLRKERDEARNSLVKASGEITEHCHRATAAEKERDSARASVDKYEGACGEAYQAVASLLADVGLFEHPDCVRILDVLAFGAPKDGKPLLPFGPVQNARAEAAEKERDEAVLREEGTRQANIDCLMHLNSMRADLAAAESRVAELEAALKLFADAADWFDSKCAVPPGDDVEIGGIFAGSLRRARAALKKQDG